ncbi:hypothetical protein ROZALSC1DRAFT_31840 [Rozella allomycis CSF55]|nr:hypothetical protein ROZALSC1DRAFT_31840 [Rozella allomycis CSF55]
MYAWGDTLWTTFSSGLFDSSNNYLGVTSTDVELSFLNSFLSQIIQMLPYKTYLYIFESSKKNIVGTSIGTDLLIYDANGVATGPKSLDILANEDSILNASLVYLNSLVGKGNYTQLVSSSNVLLFQSNNLQYLCSVSEINSKYGIKWTLLQIMSKNDVEAGIVQRNTLIFIVIGVVMVLCYLLAFIFSTWISRILNGITSDIRELASLNFGAVLRENGIHMKRRSWIREICDIQHSFQKMVLTFAEQVEIKKKSNFKGNLSTTTAGQGNSVGGSLNMLAPSKSMDGLGKSTTIPNMSSIAENSV